MINEINNCKTNPVTKKKASENKRWNRNRNVCWNKEFGEKKTKINEESTGNGVNRIHLIRVFVSFFLKQWSKSIEINIYTGFGTLVVECILHEPFLLQCHHLKKKSAMPFANVSNGMLRWLRFYIWNHAEYIYIIAKYLRIILLSWYFRVRLNSEEIVLRQFWAHWPTKHHSIYINLFN